MNHRLALFNFYKAVAYMKYGVMSGELFDGEASYSHSIERTINTCLHV